MRNSKFYRASAYNDLGALRVSLVLSLVILFLSRHVVALAIAGFSTFMLQRLGTGRADFSVLHGHPVFMLASLPALAVLLAALRRAPTGGRAIRKIWLHGRGLLIAAALLDFTLLALSVARNSVSMGELVIATALLDGYVLVYLVRSMRVKDTFADFPSPVAAPGK